MSDAEGEQRPPALEEFMAELKRLRQQAGNPSFRKMAELSGAVSHATLHLTVTGRRLQPWETVREFVRACGGDEAEWCARYRRTRAVLSGELPEPAAGTEPVVETGGPDERAVDSASGAASRDAAASDAVVVDGTGAATSVPAQHNYEQGADGADAAGSSAAASAGRGVSRRWLAVPLVVLAVVAVAGGLWAFGGDDGRAEADRQHSAGGESSSASEAGALSEPVYEGDASKLARDLGIPDGAVVAPQQKFTRTFELENAGTVHWKGRYLQRMDNETGPHHCRAPQRVRISDTPPGERVKVPVTATAAEEPTTCKVRWKMVDHTGRQLLPEYRPAYFLVHVRAGASGPVE
ncbi:NBR1-Ig-like domain-containing protein [Prauserella alba]|uniref:Nbr1 FW domain-containing protein n=1 Tax=Prauserella alba TaxID=176898 RepID=A0ABP4FUF1_9PSEU|nr:NBR1-Ig-like domain-containing protein [Prauserella alba]MCP2181812.1 Ig-like domain-containing protein [Prauserella alba]